MLWSNDPRGSTVMFLRATKAPVNIGSLVTVNQTTSVYYPGSLALLIFGLPHNLVAEGDLLHCS